MRMMGRYICAAGLSFHVGFVDVGDDADDAGFATTNQHDPSNRILTGQEVVGRCLVDDDGTVPLQSNPAR